MKKLFTFFIIGACAMQLSAEQTLPVDMQRLLPEGTKITTKNTVVTSSNNKRLVNTGSKLFFTAQTDAAGEELWVSDGTLQGTKMVMDIVPGTDGSNPQWLSAVGNRCFFSATTADKGTELWVTDGTAEGTKIVMDIYPGETSSAPVFIEAFGNNKVLFYAQDEESQYSPLVDPSSPESWLWVSDGTEAGTIRLASTPYRAQGWDDPNRRFAVTDNGKAFFNGFSYEMNETLWITDGTVDGTHPIKDINPTPATGWAQTESASIQWITAVGNKVIFRAKTVASVTNNPSLGFNGEIGEEIWVSDGTAEGTNWIGVDYAKGEVSSAGVGSQFAHVLLLKDGLVLFRADDGVHNVEPALIDLNQPFVDGVNPRMVQDINPWSPPNQPSWAEYWRGVYKGHVYFRANGTYELPGEVGDKYTNNSLWRMDVSSYDINQIQNSCVFLENWSNPTMRIGAYNTPDGSKWYTEVNDKLWFASSDAANNEELWFIDGDKNPEKYHDFADNGAPNHLTKIEKGLFFVGGVGNDLSLYRVGDAPLSIGTTTSVSLNIYPNPASDIINIVSEESVATVSINNLQGNKVLEERGNVSSINISGLNTGIYFVQVKLINGTSTVQKLVVK